MMAIRTLPSFKDWKSRPEGAGETEDSNDVGRETNRLN